MIEKLEELLKKKNEAERAIQAIIDDLREELGWKRVDIHVYSIERGLESGAVIYSTRIELEVKL